MGIRYRTDQVGSAPPCCATAVLYYCLAVRLAVRMAVRLGVWFSNITDGERRDGSNTQLAGPAEASLFICIQAD